MLTGSPVLIPRLQLIHAPDERLSRQTNAPFGDDYDLWEKVRCKKTLLIEAFNVFA